ncbi:MAG TPA: efflux RND transporter periplasmic adaptor subunit [Bacteroidales bacterium]|nr:efflux RND transporter periplasmic adaptor subunit [Bacteroidales bacterium]
MYFKIILVATLAFIMAGCNHSHETDNQPEQEEVKFQYTAYSNNFELFAEADPFVAGQTSNVLSHLSNLPDFTAVEKGAITLRIMVGNKTTEQTLESPTRKGIYSFDIKPEVHGKGTLEYVITTERGDFKVIVPEIIVFASMQEAEEAAGKIVISKTNTTVFTKEQSWKMDYSTDKPLRESFGQVIKTTAQIQSAPGDEMLVTAKTNGIISFTGNSMLEGRGVSNGQLLFTITGSGFADNNSAVRYAEAQNNFEKAKADYDRASVLAEDKIVSGKDLLQAKNLYENTKLVYDNLKQNFSASGQSVTSPMTGYIKRLFVTNGQYVEAGQPVIMVSLNKTLVLRAEVQQKYAPYLEAISTATIRILGENKTYSLEELNGKILSFGRTTSSDNYLIPVSIQIDNTGSFIPGSFVELFLKTVTNSQALTLPSTSLLEEQGNYFVYVQVTPELFEKREIKTGGTDGIKTEIIRGISENDRVVTKGAILIKLAQATGTLDAHSGHVH